MFRLSRYITSALLWLALASVSFGAPVFVQFSVTDPSYSILGGGAFTGHINGGSGITIYCDDFQNTLHSNPYAAYISDASNLSLTRFGTTSNFSYGSFNAKERYTMAAWLTTQYTYPTTPTADDLAIQTAIWTLLAQTGAAPSTGADATLVNNWLTAAGNLKTTNPSLYNTVQDELRVVTSANVYTARNRYVSGQQEYLYLVPEPGTWLLAGFGLLAIGRLRKRKA